MIITQSRIASGSHLVTPATPVALAKETNNPGLSKRSYFSKLISNGIMLCAAGLLLLSSCAKTDEFIPTAKAPASTIAQATPPPVVTTPVVPTDPIATATYYISPNGSNSASGSSTAPWQTLAYACSQVTKAGAVIHVKAGTYNETQRANLAIGVSITGEGVSSIINTSYVASGTSDGAISLNSSSIVSGNQYISYLKIQGNNRTATRAIHVNYRSNVTIHHCTIQDFEQSGIFFRSVWPEWSSPPSGYCSNNQVYNCTFSNLSTRSSLSPGHIRIEGQDGCLIHDNSFTQTNRTLGTNGNILVGDWNKGLKIYSNTFTKNNLEGNEWNFFFELWHFQGGGEIYSNTFNGGATVDIVDITKGSSTYGLKIYNNEFVLASKASASYHGNPAIDFEERGHLDYVYVYNNHFKNSPHGIWFDAYNDAPKINHIYVYSNMFENIGVTNNEWAMAINLGSDGSTAGMVWDNISIYNNTMIAGSSSRAWSGIRWSAGGSATNISIRNNIIQGFGHEAIAFAPAAGSLTVNGISIENNLYYNNATNGSSFSNVSASSKTEQNNKVSNPLFVSSSDFHLQSGSPAKDAGINVGLPFSGSAIDMGAFENKQ